MHSQRCVAIETDPYPQKTVHWRVLRGRWRVRAARPRVSPTARRSRATHHVYSTVYSIVLVASLAISTSNAIVPESSFTKSVFFFVICQLVQR